MNSDEIKQSDSDPKTVQLTPYQNYLKTQWEHTHPGQRAPIYLNEQGEPVWINRRRRRYLESLDRRKLKKQLRAQNFELKANPTVVAQVEEVLQT